MDQNGTELNLSKMGVKELAHEHSDRVRDDAVLRVMYEEEQRVKKVFRLAKVMANHAGRKTITEEDVRKVYQFMEDINE